MSWKTDKRLEMGAYGLYLPADLVEEVWDALEFGKRWPNFVPSELVSRGNGALRLHYKTMDSLQQLRDLVGAPIRVNSYYRDPAYNTKVGGAVDSYHMAGRAVDTPSYNTHRGRHWLIHHATVAGFTGFGFYPGFTHIDTGPKRFWYHDDYK